MKSPTYRLKTINDIFKVPTEKRPDCMIELLVGMSRIEDIDANLRSKLPRWLHWLCRAKLKTFTWIDDGKLDEKVMTFGKTIWERKQQ